MTFLPVVERELRVAARRRGTYWGRFAAAVIGTALAAYVLLAAEGTNEKVGADLFAVVSTVVFLYATVAGTLVTCDCLSEEKREGTLGLLFLTDLKGHDVVLGKLAATSVNAFYGMLAVLPMLAIPFILGGVSQAEMLRVVLVAINLLFFFLSIGLFVSALCRKDNWALGLSILIGLILVVGGPLVVAFNPHATALLLTSPATGCFQAFDSVYTTQPPSDFWTNAGVTFLYSWIFFGLACWIVPRSWQDGAAGKKMPWNRRESPVRRSRSRTALLEANPFLWRVARSGRKRLLIWLTLGALTLIWRRYFRLISPLLMDPGVDLFLLVPAGLILKAWIAAEASRTFSEDHRSGGMELLLTTPLHERDIVRGQMLSLWRQFAWPVAAVLLANLTFLLAEYRLWDSGSRPGLLDFHLLLGGFLVGDMISLSWDGAWLGLINRKPNRAALLAFTRILVLPTVSYLVLLCLWALVTQGNGMNDASMDLFFAIWLLLGAGADLYFGLTARARLRAEFRTIVSEGFKRKLPTEPAAKPAPALAEAQ
jgi:ABC-type transport system involved in multi-copper enzyme maturation permease subunit